MTELRISSFLHITNRIKAVEKKFYYVKWRIMRFVCSNALAYLRRNGTQSINTIQRKHCVHDNLMLMPCRCAEMQSSVRSKVQTQFALSKMSINALQPTPTIFTAIKCCFAGPKIEFVYNLAVMLHRQLLCTYTRLPALIEWRLVFQLFFLSMHCTHQGMSGAIFRFLLVVNCAAMLLQPPMIAISGCPLSAEIRNECLAAMQICVEFKWFISMCACEMAIWWLACGMRSHFPLFGCGHKNSDCSNKLFKLNAKWAANMDSYLDVLHLSASLRTWRLTEYALNAILPGFLITS